MSAQPAESCQVPSKFSVKAHYICEAKSMAACLCGAPLFNEPGASNAEAFKLGYLGLEDSSPSR